MGDFLKKPPHFLDVVPQQWAAVMDALERLAPQDRYLHWDQLKDEPEDGGVNHEAWWAALKVVRMAGLHPVGLKDGGGRAFAFGMPGGLGAILHELDTDRPEDVVRPELAGRFAASALLREAVASAGLAGATVGLEAAKEILRTGRAPRDRHERKICNLHETLQYIRGLGEKRLTPGLVLDLHRRITEGTLERPDAVGRFRRDNEPAADAEDSSAHEPPPAAELPARMDLLCAFANGEAPDFFIHPVVRAIILHFWLAYDRPFVDGNGRTARALFYQAMLRQGYTLFGFISISSFLLGAPQRYARTFLETETDDNDLTYFILHQVEAIRSGARALRDRVARKAEAGQETTRRWQGFPQLNQRQQALIAHALGQPDTRYGIARHQYSHGVTHQTARDDLFDLVRRELLTVVRERRVYVFRAAADLPAKIHSVTVRRRGTRRAITTEEPLPTTLL
jgi:Fic family protein